MKIESKGNLFLKIGIVTLVMVLLTTMTISTQKASATTLADSNGTVSREYVPDPDSRASMRWKSDGWKSEPNTDPTEYWVYEKGKKEVKEPTKVYDMKVNEEELRYIRGVGEADIFYSYDVPKDRSVTVAMDIMVTKTNEKGIIESYGLYNAKSSTPVKEKQEKCNTDHKFKENNFKQGNYGILTEAIIAKLGTGDSSYTYEIYVERFMITVAGESDVIATSEYTTDPDTRAFARWKSDGWRFKQKDEKNKYYVYGGLDDDGELKELATIDNIKINEEFRDDYKNDRLFLYYEYEKPFFWVGFRVSMDVVIKKINKDGIEESYGVYGTYELSTPSPDAKFMSRRLDGSHEQYYIRACESNFKKGQKGLLEETMKARAGVGDSSYTYEIYVDRITITAVKVPS